MSRVCEICGKHHQVGNKYARCGIAVKAGGIGLKITGKTLRKFKVNLQNVRVKDETGTVKVLRVCAKCLKNGLRKGTIMKAARGLHKRYLAEKEEAAQQKA